jgi:hypothetical protein
VGGIGVGDIISMVRVLIQVQIHKVDRYVSLEPGSDGFYDRIGRFNRDVDRFALAVFVQNDRDLGKSQNAFLDHIPKGSGKFHGHGIRPDAPKQIPDRTCKL